MYLTLANCIFLVLLVVATDGYIVGTTAKLRRHLSKTNYQKQKHAQLFCQSPISNVDTSNKNQTFEPYVNQQLNANSDNNNEALLKNLTIGFAQLRPFLNIAVPFFKEDVKARNGLLGVGGLTLLNSGVSVAFSYISRDFYNALNARDESLFYEKIEYFFIALLVAVPISVYYQFLRQKLSLYWREALTEKILNLYLNNKKYYEMELLRDIDNPDQRIGDDIRFFTRTSLDFFITLVTSIIDLFSFSAILFQIYPGLFFAIIGYAGVGTLVTTNLGRSLVSLNYEKLQREATFRFSLIRLRENSESIAFYDADAKSEKTKLWELFNSIVTNQNEIINVKRNIESFTTAYRYLVQILPSLIVAPLYFQKKVELGSISQSYGAFNHILGDFSIIINQFESISSFSAGITRLTLFLERLENIPLSKLQYTQVSADNQISYNPDFQTGHILFRYEQQGKGMNKSNDRSINSRTINNGTSLDGTVGANADSVETHLVLHHPSAQQRLLVLKCDNITVLTPDRSRVVIGAIPSYYHDEGRHDTPKLLPSPSSPLSSSLLAERDESNMIYNGVNLSVYEGQRVLIVGPSGCGKSSFLRAVAGLWTSGLGTATWYNKDGTDNTVDADIHTSLSSSENVSIPMNTTSISGTGVSRGGGSTPSYVFFLPQKPYNVLGTLKEQIMYPATNSELFSVFNSTHLTDGTDFSLIVGDSSATTSSGSISASIGSNYTDDEYFLDILRQVKLERLAYRVGNGNEHQGLYTVTDWGKVLSLGEQQRLSFARILYSKPSVVFLDEATSALDLAAEEAMYQLLNKLKVTYLSVGHRPSLLKYHDNKLVLQGPGRNIKLININHHHQHEEDELTYTTEEEEENTSHQSSATTNRNINIT